MHLHSHKIYDGSVAMTRKYNQFFFFFFFFFLVFFADVPLERQFLQFLNMLIVEVCAVTYTMKLLTPELQRTSPLSVWI